MFTSADHRSNVGCVPLSSAAVSTDVAQRRFKVRKLCVILVKVLTKCLIVFLYVCWTCHTNIHACKKKTFLCVFNHMCPLLWTPASLFTACYYNLAVSKTPLPPPLGFLWAWMAYFNLSVSSGSRTTKWSLNTRWIIFVHCSMKKY